ncbi:sigma-54 dependent transcriptional regulator [Sulfuriflexus sp.]|uniref:sigma-54 dependent transcriptional regulator n=1 Tax=Sulfuriflexus sp. TaxID=2015443 RepID=UPI0028CBF1AC|nr:sigma-54 dependent transcriptional regulator [Sulfuriflexus sp.]MDT8403934.1 sigma-54 dependent transcriptional regulator [Sulfuriflexus sp.]
MLTSKLLIIEDDPEQQHDLQVIFDFLECEDLIITGSANWQEQMDDISSLQTILLGGCSSDEQRDKTLASIQALDEDVPVLLLGEEDSAAQMESLSSAVGVLGCVILPASHSQLTSMLQKARIYRESRRVQQSERPVTLFRSLVGNSRAVRQVRRLIEQVAASTANVLILGESGTGKEVVARNLHYNSSRREHPFVPINCGAIPADLLESELFGHEKGAFTGAITARQGRFEMAEGGTLFLDEIGDMSLNMQVKLLRVLQERTFERVGSNKSIKTNVRIIAATHRNLEERIKEGEFREDLFYRLNVFPIEMPPLRERSSDIPLLVNELISRFEKDKRGSVRLTPASIISLCQYHWPGNVRELANLIERLVILYPYGVVDLAELPDKFRIQGLNMAEFGDVEELDDDGIEDNYRNAAAVTRLPNDNFDLKEHLSNMEYTFIKQALDEANGVVAHAAKRLNMRRTTLVEKLRKYDLQRGEEATNF